MHKKDLFKFTLSIILFICTSVARSQEHVGLTASNYAGVTKVSQNPAYLVGSPLFLDINWVGLRLNLENNTIKGDNFSVFKPSNSQFLYKEDPNYTSTSGFKSTNKSKRNFISFQNRIIGPSFMFSTKNLGFSFGINQLFYLTSKKINDHVIRGFGSFDFSEFEDKDDLEGDLSLLLLSGTEYAFSFGKTLIEHRYYRLQGGITTKLILGSYNKSIYNKGGFPRRKGLGFDIGFSYQNERIYKKRGQKHHDRYKWRFDGSIKDLGFVGGGNFNSVVGELDAMLLNPLQRMAKIFDEEYNEKNYQDPLVDLTFLYDYLDTNDDIKENANKNVVMFLPTTVALHYDRNIHQRWYFGSSLMKNATFGRMGFKGANLLSFIPRYESGFFDFALPITFYDFNKPRVGFSLKLGILSFGSDRLSGLFLSNSDLYGANFYFNIRTFIRKKNQPIHGPISRMIKKMNKKNTRKRFHIQSPKI